MASNASSGTNKDLLQLESKLENSDNHVIDSLLITKKAKNHVTQSKPLFKTEKITSSRKFIFIHL